VFRNMSAGWSKIKYKQDLPPLGGYGKMPFRRNLIPLRTAGATIFAAFVGINCIAFKVTKAKMWLQMVYRAEDKEALTYYEPLLEAENDRRFLRWKKEKIESEALNIVGAGYDPDFLPGNEELYYNKAINQTPHIMCEELGFSGGDNVMADSMRWYYTRFENLQCGP